MGKFSDKRESHKRETPKSVLKPHSNSQQTHELCVYSGDSKSRHKLEEIMQPGFQMLPTTKE